MGSYRLSIGGDTDNEGSDREQPTPGAYCISRQECFNKAAYAASLI